MTTTNRTIVLPARASSPRQGRFVPLSPEWRAWLRRHVEHGGSPGDLKVAMREAAKRHPLYHLPVEVRPPVEGRTDRGIPIPVNTLGRWLWGVPGYAGNAVFDGFADPPGVWLPAEAPEEADRLLSAIRPR